MKSCLVVDDSSVVRKVARRILEDLDYIVDEAEDGQEAFDKPKAQKGVFVLENGRAKFVPVETGITGDSDIQILSGLSADQEVITGPSKILNTLKDDTQVRKQERQGGGPGGGGGNGG